MTIVNPKDLHLSLFNVSRYFISVVSKASLLEFVNIFLRHILCTEIVVHFDIFGSPFNSRMIIFQNTLLIICPTERLLDSEIKDKIKSEGTSSAWDLVTAFYRARGTERNIDISASTDQLKKGATDAPSHDSVTLSTNRQISVTGLVVTQVRNRKLVI